MAKFSPLIQGVFKVLHNRSIPVKEHFYEVRTHKTP